MWYPVNRSCTKIALLLLVCSATGVLIARGINHYWPAVTSLLTSNHSLYRTTDPKILDAINTTSFQQIGWQQLLPEPDKKILQHYQSATQAPLADQMLRSLQASTDQAYRASLYSTNTVASLIGKAVAVSGFVVPIDVSENRHITSFFLVPYYGACIHFPPPPPNQMIFIRLSDGLALDSIQTPVTVTGILQRGLFEDPLGTSAYILNASQVDTFVGQPDDFRQHDAGN